VTMSTDRIERALMAARETRAIELGYGVLDRTGAMVAEVAPGRQVLVIADENTFVRAGAQVLASLRASGVPVAGEPLIFPGSPTLYADYDNVERVRDRLAGAPGAVACSIGAGTLNDLTKLASHELQRPYAHVCTAASVDGYSAFGASIAVDGFKTTHDCAAPVGLIADLEVMTAAPQRLTATGYGDLSEKIPAGADWILADVLGIEAIEPAAWSLVQESAREVLQQPAGIARSDPSAVAGLTEALLLSGLGMQAARSSRPASGAGHQFSHTWEMEGHGLDQDPPLSHGFKVGIGSIASCAVWEAALAIDVTALDRDRVIARAPSPEQIEAQVRAALPPRIVDEAVAASLSKQLRGPALRDRFDLVVQRWPLVRDRVRPQLVSASSMMEMLRVAGAPHHPALIGIGMERFRATHQSARMIRRRYTVLDVLADLGVLPQVIDGLFAPDGFWGRHRDPAAP